MSDKIADIRERHKASDNNFIEYESTWDIHADRATLLAEVARLNKDLLAQNACCDGAAAQDAHIRREREEHRAEVEKLRSEIERLKQEPELLRAELISLANAARNALADAYDRAREGKP